MLMSSNMSSLVLVSELCKQHSRKDRSCLFHAVCPRWFPTHVNNTTERTRCQATCPRCFLFQKHVNHVNNTAGRTGRAYVKQLVLVGFFAEICKRQNRVDRMCPCQAACPLFPLFFCCETCKQHSRKDMSRLCQATCSRWFLLPKNVNKTAGRTGCAYVKQLVHVGPCFRTMHTTQPGGQVVPMPSNMSSLVLALETCKQHGWEDRLCSCQATCPRSVLFPNYVNNTAGRTGRAYAKQLVLVGPCFRTV